MNKTRQLYKSFMISQIIILFIALLVKPPFAFGREIIPQELLPTVTGTPLGSQISVLPNEGEDQINVRSGPHITYEKVGVLLPNQPAAALGKIATGEWILIEYPGVENGQAWVYAPLVSISGGDIPIVEPPSTPTPAVTPTIDPTMAARFVITAMPTRLSTYTEVAPLVIPTFEETSTLSQKAGIPIGLFILVIGALGLFLGLFTIAQGR
ncbi:MAG: SH3 domain-containing protein [Anaerolineaceae bacterium]|nr:SH3 domain-containing protein [Anaerolineaceae bacterium]